MIHDHHSQVSYIPLKDLPNRTECIAPGCGTCLPEMKEKLFRDPMGGVQIKLVVPFCRTTGICMATLEEAAYAELLGCRKFLLQESVVTGKTAKIVRRCLGFHVDEMELMVGFPASQIKAIEDHENGDYPTGNMWHMILIGLVCKQIHKYES